MNYGGDNQKRVPSFEEHDVRKSSHQASPETVSHLHVASRVCSDSLKRAVARLQKLGPEARLLPIVPSCRLNHLFGCLSRDFNEHLVGAVGSGSSVLPSQSGTQGSACSAPFAAPNLASPKVSKGRQPPPWRDCPTLPQLALGAPQVRAARLRPLVYSRE